MIFKSVFPDVPPSVLDHNKDNLYTHVFKNIDRHANKTALIDASSGSAITFRELRERINLVAANLIYHFQLHPRQKVALYLPNLMEYPVLFFAVIRAGGVVTTVNPIYTAYELNKQLVDSGAVMVVTLAENRDKAVEGCKGTSVSRIILLDHGRPNQPPEVLGPLSIHCYTELLRPYQHKEEDFPEVSPSSLAVLPYSSGTTGLPKGVMLTHQNIISNILQYTAIDDYSENDVIAGFLPFYHIFGMVVVMSCGLRKGVTIVLLKPKFEIVELFDAIQRHKISRMCVVPPVVIGFVKHPSAVLYDMSSLKWLMSGAAPLSPELQQIFHEKYPHVRLKQGWGMTELSPVGTTDNPRDPIVPGSCGKLLPNTQVKIVDVETKKDLGHKESGEIWIKGPQVMVGYYNQPAETAKTIDADGFLHTGDIGFIDHAGNLFISDRLKELIKVSGFQVPPAELEGILLSHPKIADAAVVAYPDHKSGEVPKAFVVIKPNANLTATEVTEFVSAKVSPYKKIHHVEFIDAIPKVASGKILRRVLQEKDKQRMTSKL